MNADHSAFETRNVSVASELFILTTQDEGVDFWNLVRRRWYTVVYHFAFCVVTVFS